MAMAEEDTTLNPTAQGEAPAAGKDDTHGRGQMKKAKERFEARFFKPLPASTAAQEAATRVYSQGNVMKRTDPYVEAVDRNGQKFPECAWRTSMVSTVIPVAVPK